MNRILAEPEPPESLQKKEWQAEIERLYLRREELVSNKQVTDEVDEQIVSLKRKARQGHQLQAGDWIADRFQLCEELGRGGFAVVWRAFDVVNTCSVAVKVLHFQDRHEQQRVERFRRGARKMRGLTDLHIVRVLDGPSVSNGFDYFVMEYLPGGDLSKAIIDKKLDWRNGLLAVLEVGKAMARYHSQGMIHRDIKPQNILLAEDGVAKLSDFDLVFAPDSTGGTRSEAMGTFNYAAPEAIADGSKVDKRADLYSLGVTVLFVILGKSVPGDFIHNYNKHIYDLKCSNRLKNFIRKAVDFEPKKRFQSAEDFCDELSKSLKYTDDNLANTSKFARLRLGRNRLLPLLGVVCVSLLFAGGWAWRYWRQPPPTLPSSHPSKPAPVPPTLPGPEPSKPTVQKPPDKPAPETANSKRDKTEYFLSLAHGGQLDAALAVYNAELSPAGQQQSGVEKEYKRIVPIYVKKHLRQAKSARKKGNCDEFQANILVILNVQPSEPKARAELTKTCKNKKPSKRARAKALAGPAPVVSPGPKPLNKDPAVAEVAGEVPKTRPPETPNPGEADSPPPAITSAVSTSDGPRVRSWFFRAEQHYSKGQYSQAITDAKQVRAESPAGAWVLIGRAACKLGDIDQAASAMPHLSATDQRRVLEACTEAKYVFRDGKFSRQN